MSSIHNVDKKTFAGFLNDHKRLYIPAFQRPYSWQPRNLVTFWENILTASEGYYIGNLVIISDKSRLGLEVIDGQQRITTLFLFFIALRDFIANTKLVFQLRDQKIEGIERFLWDKEDFTDSKEVRLKFNKRNLGSVFEAMVLGKTADIIENDLDDNQKRFIKNYNLLSKNIKEYFKGSMDLEKQFLELTDKIKKLEFITIVCNTDSDAYKLFEGLNSTGLELSVVDLLKNSVFKTINEKSKNSNILVAEAEEIWSAMESEFEQNDIKQFSRFIRHQWISNKGYISNSKLFDEIKKQELGSSTTARDVINYIKKLHDDAKIYINIRKAETLDIQDKLARNNFQLEVRDMFNVFRSLNVEQVYAVLLSLVNRFISDSGYTTNQFISDVKQISCFAIKTRFLSISPASYESIFADFCKDFSNAKGTKIRTKVQTFFNKLSKLVDSDAQKEDFVVGFSDDLRYKSSDTGFITYILQKIYHESNPTIKVNLPTIDHFIPQEASKWNIENETLKTFVHKIGNLALLNEKLNQKIQNAGLDEKIQKIYSQSEFNENKYFVHEAKSFKDNPEDAIKKRGVYLAEKAFTIFAVKK